MEGDREGNTRHDEIDRHDAQDGDDEPAIHQKREVVDEIPFEISTHDPEESAPQVGDLLQALTGDDGGNVNESLPKQTDVHSSDEGLASGSDDYIHDDHVKSDDRKPQNEVKNDGKSDLKADDNWNTSQTDQNPEIVNGFSADLDSEDLLDVGGFDNSTDDNFDTDEMNGRMYSSPEPELPFTQSKIKDVEPSNINGLLQSLKDVPKPKPPSKVDQTPPRSPRKVTDDEVADALRFLLGKGGRVPRTRSAMDLRDESARKLRGEDKTGSRTFVLAMMPDGTQRRVSVDRRPSLGNDLDSDDQINLVGEALRELTPGTYQRKLPKNDFDGREERPPTPRDSSSSTSSVSSNEDNTAAKPNQDSSDRDEDFNSKDYPINNVDDDDTLASVSEEEDKTQKEELDVVTPSSYKPNEDKIDLSNLYKLRPDGGTDLPTESSTKPLVTVPVTIDELVDNLPIFDSESESDEDANLQEHKNIPIMEADIHASAAVIPEESSVDLNILESEPPVSLPVDETRSPSSSDASSRSTLRPHGSSDASSRSSEWQEDTEDEIILESKVSTESSPDLTSLEKLRPEGIEAPHLGDDDTAPSKETSNMPTERSGATVKDLEYILPALESSSDSDEEVNEHDEQLYPVDEEPLNPIKVNPDNAQIDLSNLDKTDSDLENDEGDESRPYDVSDILDDLSSTEEDWPVPPESPVQQDWPAPPDDDMHYSGIHDQKFDNEDYDLPPPPPPDTRSSSRSSMSSPENRVPSFMAVEAPKRPVSRGSSSKSSPSSTSSLGKDPKTKKPSEPEPPAIVITASSDDFRHTDESDEDVFDENEDKHPQGEHKKEDFIVSILIKPSEMTPDLGRLEKFNPDGTDEIYLESAPCKTESLIPNKKRGKVSDMEDLVPKFDSSSESDDDDQEQQRSPVVEADICMSEAPQPEESSVDLSDLDRNMRQNTDVPVCDQDEDGRSPTADEDLDQKPIPRKDTELSTESQEFTMDFEDSDVDEIVIPVSHVPVESSPDLVELERKLRPSGTKSPDIDLAQPVDNRPTERTGATVADLKDLVPTFDTTSESSQSDSSEPITPVDEMIEEIGSVSPTRRYFDFDGLENLTPIEKEEPSLETYARQKSEDIIVESYMSLFREERVMELLKTSSSDSSFETMPSEHAKRTADKEFVPEIVVRERGSISSSAEGGSSSGSDDEHEYNKGRKLPEADIHVPDSPAKKRRSVGQEDNNVEDDEVPAKKPKTFEIPDEVLPEESTEPVIIEAGISVFRDESIVESSPPAIQAKLETVKAGSGDESEWPAPPAIDEEWPAPPPEMMVREDWPVEEGNFEPRKSENGKEDMDMDADDTSSVSSSSTEGEYITEPSPSPGADRVFVLTVVPVMETFNEEDEGEDDEMPVNDDLTSPGASVSESDDVPVDSKPSSSSESEASSGSRNEQPHDSDKDDEHESPYDQDRKEKDERALPEEEKPSISTIEPLESTPFEKSEMQPEFAPKSDNLNDIPKTEIDLEMQNQTKPEAVDERRMSSSSDNSSGDAKVPYPQMKSDDEEMKQKSYKNGEQEEFQPSPTTHDSETESDTTESSSDDSSRKSPFSPFGARVFILTGLPSNEFSDTPVSDNDSENVEKIPQEEDDIDPSELKQFEQTEPIPDLIPALTSPTERETPDFIEEPAVEIEPIENLESAPVITSSESDDEAEQSPEPVISPNVASDTFSSPISDAEGQKRSDIYEVPSDHGVSEDFLTLEQPEERFEEEEEGQEEDYFTGSDNEQADLEFYEPRQPTFDKTAYNEPTTYFEKPPSPSQVPSSTNGHWSPPSIGFGSARSTSPSDQIMSKQPTEQSGHGPSFSHYISTSKPADMSHPAVPNLAPKFHSDNFKYTTDDSYLSSDTEVAQFTANMPSETDITDPSVPNLAPYMPPSIYKDHIDPETLNPLDQISSDTAVAQFTANMPSETDITDPAVPNLAPYMPPSINKDHLDPVTLNPLDQMYDSKSTDIIDPASPAAYDSEILPSKETDINDPGTVPFIQESKFTDITDPAVPEYIPERPRQKSPFEPVQLEASPKKYLKARPITPVELETSLVPPDVYTSDDAYDQFQVQYRGHIDDDLDTIPQMRQKPPEPAKTKRKRPEEKRRKKEQPVSDMPSYMAPPPPIPSEVARAKGKKVAPPTPPRIESDPLLREPRHLGAPEPTRQPYLREQPKRYSPDEFGKRHRDRPSSMEMDDPPVPYQVMSKSTDISFQQQAYVASHSTRDVSEFSLSYSSRSRSTDIIDHGHSYPAGRSMSTDYLSSEPAPFPIQNRPPTHARSMDIHSASIPPPHRAQPRSRSTDLTDPAVFHPSQTTDIDDPGLYYPPPQMSKSTDINDPGFEPPVPRPTNAAPQYLVPNRGPLPDISKPPPGMHKDVELESLKRQLHRLGTKMTTTRQELEHMKRNNPANKYATPADRAAHSRGSSRSSIDSPDADLTDLKFSRKFFASLTDKEFGKMLEEMRLYRLAVREKGADLKRLSKQCDGIRLRLKQLGEPLDFPAPETSTRVGAIETTI